MSETYPGGELALFAKARNWKRYVAARLGPYVAGSVLEVGAGIGSNIGLFAACPVAGWTGLEPDAALAEEARQALAASRFAASGRILARTLASVEAAQRFDTILYIDVVEHIADDRDELVRASGHLAPGGRLIVLAPAHQLLFSAFDRAIGHHRRYNLTSLTALTPPGLVVERRLMLDAAGLLASIGNRFGRNRAMPTAGQIAIWDRLLVPASRLLDPGCCYRIGKTVVVIWRRP